MHGIHILFTPLDTVCYAPIVSQLPTGKGLTRCITVHNLLGQTTET